MHGTDGQTTHVMNAGLVPLAALVAAAGARASYRFFEFFTAQIRNPNTRRAYARAAAEFFDWVAARGVTRGHQRHTNRNSDFSVVHRGVLSGEGSKVNLSGSLSGRLSVRFRIGRRRWTPIYRSLNPF
jgi:hypothetical protein